MNTKSKTLPVLLSEEKGKIYIVKEFVTKACNLVQDILNEYNKLEFTSPLDIDDIKSMFENWDSFVKAKQLESMPDQVEIQGMRVNKNKAVDLLEAPDTRSLEIKCKELQKEINNIMTLHKSDVALNGLCLQWNRFIDISDDQAVIDDSAVENFVERNLKVFATTEKQIKCLEALKLISQNLNQHMIPNVDRDFYTPLLPHSQTNQRMLSWERFFQKVLKWDTNEKAFEPNMEFLQNLK